MHDELFCFFIHQFSAPICSIWRTATRSKTPVCSYNKITSNFFNSRDKFLSRDKFINVLMVWIIKPPFIMVWIIKHYKMEFDMNEIPVFIKTSTPLILYFPPVIPANLSYTRIHESVCKDNPSKRSPRSSKICIWMSSITCYNTSAMAPETTQS